MHVHLPKPLHGWREFMGEIGTIVIGVLIALAGEQIIEALHWRHEVADYRTALRSEIAHNLGTYEFRKRQDRCVDFRLHALETWLNSWRAGHPLALAGPIGLPESLMIFTSVWMGHNAQIESHMPLSERLGYSRLYDRFANNEVHRVAERNVWLELGDYDGATVLDNAHLMRLQGLINQARYREDSFDRNATNYAKQASELRVRAAEDPSWPKLTNKLCRSILSGPHEQRGSARL